MTGDLGRLDEAGYLRVTGRKKDVIIRGGRKIHPARIEALALRHAGDREGGGVSGCRCAAGRAGLSCRRDARTRPRSTPRRSIAPSRRARACRDTTCRNSCCNWTEMPLTASGKIVKRELMQGGCGGPPGALAGALPGAPPRQGLADASDRRRTIRPSRALRVRETPAPVPGPGEVLVEIHAAPVNYVDLLVVGGVYQFMPPLPFIPGKSPAGIVSALGPGVTTLAVGDRVLAMAEQGGYAEAVDARRRPMPPPAGSTVLLEARRDGRGLRHLLGRVARAGRGCEPGETVLVLGASGGVGQAAVQLARAMGARVLAGISRPERAATARAAGADAIIDLSRDNLRDSLARTGLCRDRRARRRYHHRPARRTRFSRRRCGHWRGAAGWW